MTRPDTMRAGHLADGVRAQQHADLGDLAEPVDAHRHRLDVEQRQPAAHLGELEIAEPPRIRRRTHDGLVVGIPVGIGGAHAHALDSAPPR